MSLADHVVPIDTSFCQCCNKTASCIKRKGLREVWFIRCAFAFNYVGLYIQRLQYIVELSSATMNDFSLLHNFHSRQPWTSRSATGCSSYTSWWRIPLQKRPGKRPDRLLPYVPHCPTIQGLAIRWPASYKNHKTKQRAYQHHTSARLLAPELAHGVQGGNCYPRLWERLLSMVRRSRILSLLHCQP